MLSKSEMNISWSFGNEVWVGSLQIHTEKSPALEEQLSGPFPAVDGAPRCWGLGNLTAEEQPGNLAGDRENDPCGSGSAPSKADSGRSLSSQIWGSRWGGGWLCLLMAAVSQNMEESGRRQHCFGTLWLSLKSDRARVHRNY